MYIESGTVTLAGIIALTGLRRFEDKNDNLTRRHVLLVLGDVQPKFADIVAAMTNLGLKVSDIDYDEHLVEKKEVALTFDVKIPNQIGVERLIAELEKFQGVRRIQIRVPT
jgi:putative Mg2+ transporter-C (MgtC) family protein